MMQNFDILYHYYQCKTSSFDNSISYLEQEIDFQLGGILPVKSCKFASHSYGSRAKYCAVFYLESSITIVKTPTQPQFNLT